MPESDAVTDFAPSGPPISAVADRDDPTAVMGRRILAWVLDLLIFGAVVGSVFAGLADYVEVPPGFAFDACDQLQDRYTDEASGCVEVGDRAYITSAGDNGIQTLVSLGYFAFFVVLQGVTGASPGKLLTGLRVVDEQGRIAGVGRSLGRTLLWVVDGAPWIVPAVGFITGLTSVGHRRVGDLAARTYVVGRRDVGLPPVSPPVTSWTQESWTAPSPVAGGWPPAPATEVPAAAPTDLPPPQWDPARGTYLQWQPAQQQWLQWDAAANRWKPIDS